MTKMPKVEIVACRGCGVPFKRTVKSRGRPQLYHNRACAKRNWDTKHPRQAVPE